MKHRISRRAFLRGCGLLAASAAVSSLTSCGETKAKDSGLPQIVVGSDTYPPYIYLNNDGVPAGIDVEIATEAFRRMGYSTRFEPIDWEQKTTLVESGAIDCIWGCFSMEGREALYHWAGPYMAPTPASRRGSMCSASKTAASSMRCWAAATWTPSPPMRRPSCNI